MTFRHLLPLTSRDLQDADIPLTVSDIHFDKISAHQQGLTGFSLTSTSKSDTGLEEAMRYMRAGDTLCIWRLDRLSRSLHDLLALAQELERAEIGLLSVTEAIDTTTPNGRLFFSIAGAFAQFERDVIQQRTLEGMAAAREAGRKPGPKVKVTEEQWSAIRPRIASGEISIGQAAKILGLNKSTVSRRFNAASTGPAAGYS